MPPTGDVVPVCLLSQRGLKAIHPVTVSYLVDCLETSLGKKANRNYMPMPPTGDVLKTSADVSKAEAELGYKPTTPLNVGIDKFIEWYQDYFKDGMAKDVQVYVPY